MSKPTNGKPALFFSKTIRTIQSPKGSALFAKLVEPDVYKGGDPTWKITLVFNENDQEFIDFKATLAKFSAEFTAETGKTADPFAMIRPDKMSGEPSITFSSKVKMGDDGNAIPVIVVDAAKKPTSADVRNGSQCRAAIQLGGWTSPFGAGIKAYLNAVQVISLGSGSSGGFTSTDVFDSAPTASIELPF